MVLLVLALLIVVVVLLIRSGRSEADGRARLDRVEATLARLRRRIDELEGPRSPRAEQISDEPDELVETLGPAPPPPPLPEETPDPRAMRDVIEEVVGAPVEETGVDVDEAYRSPVPDRPGEPAADRSFDLEQWLGVRGAAIAGGIALSLAGLYFVHYAIAEGWISEAVRVTIAAVLGALCMLSMGPLLKRGYEVLGQVLAGAGAVLLYGAGWASFQLYGFFPLPVAFGWMAAVTVACGLLSMRHGSRLTGLFGAVGGFATPLLLSTGENRPIGLFGYVLLVDLGLIALGRRMAWPVLGAVALIGTSVLQLLWIAVHLDAPHHGTGLVVLGLFALLFLAVGLGSVTGDRDRLGSTMRYGALLMPLVFALYFASRVDLGERLLPLGGLMLILNAGGLLAALRARDRGLASAVAVGGVGVLAIWVARHRLDAASTWELASVLALLTVMHALVESWERRRAPDRARSLISTLTCSITAFVLLGAASLSALPAAPFAPAFAGLIVIGITMAHGAERVGVPWMHLLLGAGLGCFLAAHGVARVLRFDSASPEVGVLVGLAAGLAVAGLVLGWRRVDRGVMRARLWGVAGVTVPLLALLFDDAGLGWTSHAASLLVLGLLAVLAVSRAGTTWLYVPVALALAGSMGEFGRRVDAVGLPEIPGAALVAIVAVAVSFLALLPLVIPNRAASTGRVARASAFAPLLLFGPGTLEVFSAYNDGVDGYVLVALGLAAIAAVGVHLADRVPGGRGRVAGTTYAKVGGLLLAFGLAYELEAKWFAMGLALTGFGWCLLARFRPDAARIFRGANVLVAACVLVTLDGLAVGNTPVSANVLFNGLLYTHALPALLCGVALALARPADERLRRQLGLGCALTLFVWINLVVMNAYTEGRETIDLLSEHVPARDLTMSLSWAVYALVLLGIGTARRLAGPRWLSLACLMAAAAKVFLYDLSHLGGLYRVGSVAGLAVCLLSISVLYQRFVFRTDAKGESSE